MIKGRCVICGTAGPLTRDHVPPQSVTIPVEVEIKKIPDLIDTSSDRKNSRKGFRSAQFPTLCSACNNERLGKEYDPVLAKFIDDVLPGIRLIKQNFLFKEGIEVKTKPLRLVRAVVGHLLAAEERSNPTEEPIKGRIPELMQVFFLDPNAPWPKELSFHLWPYFEHDQVVFRGLSTVKFDSGIMVCGDLLKFFPMAFLVTIDFNYPSFALPFGPDLTLDSEVSIRVPATNLPPVGWPQFPGPKEGVLLNDKRTSVAQRNPENNLTSNNT